MFDIAAHRMNRERFGKSQLFGAVDIEAQHRVGAGVPQYRGVIARDQFKVLRISTVAVEHRRDLALAAGLA